jgi:hypothetical protein
MDSDITWPKMCDGCGLFFTITQWEKLKYVGVAYGSSLEYDVELRNCNHCNLTLMQPCPTDIERVK